MARQPAAMATPTCTLLWSSTQPSATGPSVSGGACSVAATCAWLKAPLRHACMLAMWHEDACGRHGGASGGICHAPHPGVFVSRLCIACGDGRRSDRHSHPHICRRCVLPVWGAATPCQMSAIAVIQTAAVSDFKAPSKLLLGVTQRVLCCSAEPKQAPGAHPTVGLKVQDTAAPREGQEVYCTYRSTGAD